MRGGDVCWRGACRGSSLMAVVFALMILSFTVAGLINYMRVTQDMAVRAAQDFRARELAEMGLVLALHPAVESGDPLLAQEVGTDSGFRVRVTGEQGKFPVNAVTDPVLAQALVQLFKLWGASEDEATEAVDGIVDWVDLDGEPSPRGAEAEWYEAQGLPQRPRDGSLGSLDELLLVKGFEVIDRLQPSWRDSMTIYNVTAQVDVNAASPAVLEALTGTGVAGVRSLVDRRRGPDGIEGTEDDEPLGSVDEIVNSMGLGASGQTVVSTYLTTSRPVLRIESTGRAGMRERTLVWIGTVGTDGRPSQLAKEW